jgi:hypothetical protein
MKMKGRKEEWEMGRKGDGEKRGMGDWGKGSSIACRISDKYFLP